jgi:serine/threonine protein kinase
MIGRTLGPYRVDARLGEGGMGVVYRAYDLRLQRTVALKVVRRLPALLLGEGQVLEEARAASALNHPNICTVYDVREIDGEAFIAMEYVAGRPLSQLVPEGGLPYEDVLRYASEVASALAHAHERGVIHRDLKSANVVISEEGRAKVLDFGIARRIEAASGAETSSGRLDPQVGIAGTTAYIAPEVLLGDPADVRSDIWSLGVLMFEMAAGAMPFTGRNQFDLTSAIIRDTPAPLPTRVPVSLRGIILRCLAKDPVQRYQRAGEVRAALEALQSDVAAPAPAASPGSRSLRFGIGAGLVLLAAAAALWLRPSPPPLSERLVQGQLTQVLSSSQPISDPSLSPDGKMIVFTADDNSGRTDIYTSRVTGGARIRLTNDDDVESDPRFSPDGDRIAFAVRRRNGGASEVRILPAFGGDAISIIQHAQAPAWSPDGRLAYLRSTSEGNMELVTSRSDGSDARVVLRGESAFPFLRHPAWSPEGDEIAVVRGTGGIAGEIWRVPVSGGSPRKLGDDPPAVHADWPSYAPDGSGILHASNRGGATNIWLSPRDGSAPVRLTTGPGADEAPSMASDGTIAFVNSRWKNVLETYQLPAGPAKVIASHTPFLWAPVFSPDGRDIAFSRAEVDGSWHIWTVPIDGGSPRKVTDGEAGELYPRYTPDGKHILFHTWNAPRRIGRVPRQGGAPVMLSFGADKSDGYADVSPDGARIVLTRTEADAERLYVASAAGGEARLLTSTPGAVARWSPDGTLIAFGGSRGFTGGVFVIAPDGTKERRLTKDGGWPVWWPGQGIAYLGLTAGGGQEIRLVDLQGRTSGALDVVTFVGSNHPFDVSRAGDSLVASNAVHISNEIWRLQEKKK